MMTFIEAPVLHIFSKNEFKKSSCLATELTLVSERMRVDGCDRETEQLCFLVGLVG